MSSIVLRRVQGRPWSYGTSLAAAVHCRLDPCSPGHAAAVDEAGVLHVLQLPAAGDAPQQRPAAAPLRSFELAFRPDADAAYEPVGRAWLFEYVPGQPGELLLAQAGSCRVLYAALPGGGEDASDVFAFGAHTSPVTCIAASDSDVLSGCSGGVIKLWRLSDGQLASSASEPPGMGITALQRLGPSLVAAGTSAGSVSIYDTATGELLAVQRLLAGPGPVACLAGWLPPQLLAGAALAGLGPRVPDGGGVLPGPSVGAPWHSAAAAAALEHEQDAQHGEEQQHALLAVASASGWLCVFAACVPGSHSWALLHSNSGSLAAAAPRALAWAPDGRSLVVASPAEQLLGTDAVAVAAAGGQPGAVSCYRIASSAAGHAPGPAASSAADLLPPLLLERRHSAWQPLPLQMWHQWSLASVPVGLAVLPASGFSLLDGKALQASKVLHLFALPEFGPGLVLTASQRLMEQRPSGTAAQAAAALELQLAGAAAAAATAALQEVVAAAAGATSGQDERAAGSAEQAQQAAAAAAASASQQQQERGWQQPQQEQLEDDDDLLLNLAERDLAAVADAIAAAAGPMPDPELAALLADVMAATGGAEPAPVPAPSAADGTAELQQPGSSASSDGDDGDNGAGDRAAPVAHGAGEPAADAAGSMQQPAGGGDDGGDAAPAAAAPSAADARLKQQQHLAPARTSVPAAATGLRLPMTLPGVRSWMDPAAAVAAGVAAPASPAARPSLAALAEDLRQEQLRQQQEEQLRQQEHAQLEQQRQELEQQRLQQRQRVLEEEARKQEQQQPWQSEQQQPSPATAALPQQQQQQQEEDAQAQEQELPCESSLQHLFQQQPEPQSQPQLQQQQQQQQGEQQQQQLESAQPAAGPAAVESQPQPRQLPAMLLQHRPAAAPPHAAPASCGAPPAQAAGRRPAAVTSAAVRRTAADAPRAADAGQAQTQAPRQQPEQQPPAGAEPLQVPEAPAPRARRQAPSAVQQRLSLRQQSREQQQQQQPAAAEAARLPASDHPLAHAVANSSRLLARKIQEAEAPPQVSIAPDAPPALALAASRLAELDLGRDDAQYDYDALPQLKDVPTPKVAARLVPKQLDAQWVASRSLKPDIAALFRPADWQAGCVHPQLLVLPAWPTPAQVAQGLLWPGQG